MKNLISFLIKILVINFFIGFSGAHADDVLKIYSERQPMLIEPLLNEFESQTGIDVEWIYSKKGLVQKIILEKDKPVADVFLASDISRLIDVAEAGASIKINNSSAVPSHLQSDNWIGLTQRARIIYVNKDLGLNDITYEDLVSETDLVAKRLWDYCNLDGQYNEIKRGNFLCLLMNEVSLLKI